MYEDTYHLGIKALIQNSEGKFLLLKVNPQELKKYLGDAYWDIPGGRVQRGDSIEQTLKRELQEETGISNIKSITPFSMVVSNIRIPTDNDDVGLILSSYICEVEETNEIKLSKEHIEAKWFSPREAANLLEFKYPQDFTEKIRELA